MRNCRIVATIGPASSTPDTLRRLLNEGVDVFRLNYSHGTREEHTLTIRRIRRVCRRAGVPAAILQDLSGPRLRAGRIRGGAVLLATGSRVRIRARSVTGTADCFSTNYARLARDVRKGHRILLDDGALELRVHAVSPEEVRCRVIAGGILRTGKGMNLPDSALSVRSPTAKDLRDLDAGIAAGVDFVALSFVRSGAEIRSLKRRLARRGCAAQVIAKIERAEAVEALDDIVSAADGVLVARGDLVVETDLAHVPFLQKEIIGLANEQDKYVVTATQMLESMIRNRRPTRAEAADVANAILDGTDAIMLSGETAVGEHPVEAVRVMRRIAEQTDDYLRRHPPDWTWSRLNPVHPVQDAIGHAAFTLCRDVRARAIVAFSTSGGTALFLSKSRPFVPILVFTASPKALRRMCLFWGVTPVLEKTVRSKDDLLRAAERHLTRRGLARKGDPVVLVLGSHFGHVGSTNIVAFARLARRRRSRQASRKKRRHRAVQ